MRIAIPTTGKRKLTNRIADTFSHAEHYTIINIYQGKYQATVIPNPAKGLKRGAGPITAKHLSDNKVDLVITSEIGPGLKEILSQYEIEYRLVESGITVRESLQKMGINGHDHGDSLE